MRLLIFLALACSLIASDQLSTARLGYTLAADGSLLTVDGVPGAAHLSSTTDPLSYLGLQSASHARLTLAWTTQTLTICGASCSTLPLTVAPRAVAVSPSGIYASLLSARSLITYALSDLHATSLSLAELGVTSSTGAALAISDTGTTLLTTSTLLLVSPLHGHPTLTPGTFTLPRFLPHSAIGLAYASTDHALVLLDPASLSVEQLLGQADGLTAPTAIEIAPSGTVWVSQSGAAPLLSYNLTTHAAAAYSLGAGTLHTLGTPGVYLWSDSALLDATRSTPQVLVIASEAH